MARKKCGLSTKDVKMLVNSFESDIDDCCTKNMSRYTELKEKLPESKEFCDLVNEMLGFGYRILGKIDAVIEILKMQGCDDDVIKVSERRKFVEGVVDMLVKDREICG